MPDDAAAHTHRLPEPLDPDSYFRGRLAAVTDAELGEGWALHRSWKPTDQAITRRGFVNVPMAVTEQPGAELIFDFAGSAGGDFVAGGPDAGTIDYRVDGGPWQQQDLFTPWSQSLQIPWAHVLAAGLTAGPHTLTLRVAELRNGKSHGHAVRIAHFLVNGP